MSQSETPICRDFFHIVPEDVREKLIPRIIALYVNEKLREGDTITASYVLYNAIRKGYKNEYLEKLYDYVNAIETIRNYLMESSIVLDNLSSVPSSFIKNLLNDLEAYYDRVRSILPGELRDRVEKVISLLRDAYTVTSFYEEAVPVINEAYGSVSRFIEMISSAGDNLDMVENAFGYAVNEFPRIIDRLNSLIEKQVIVHNPEFVELRNRIDNTLITVRDTLKGLYVFAEHGLPVIGYLQALVNELRGYGEGTNNLANDVYRNTLIDFISTILSNVKELKKASTYTVYPEDVRDMMSSFADAVVNTLNSMKKQLGSRDGRFVDVFDEAERRAGFELVDVSKPENPVSEGLEEFVRNVAENSMNAFRSDNLFLKVLGAIAVVGSGALDNLTIILRPKALVEQLEALKTMFTNTANAVEKQGLMGLANAGRQLFLDMFGSPERALYSIGGILSALALAMAIEKVPLPTRWRAVLVDLLQGDPVGLAVSSAEAIGLTKILRQAIIKPNTGKIIIDTIPGSDTTIKKILEESFRRASIKEASKISDVLVKKIARIIRRGADYVELKKVLTEAIKKYGLEELINTYSKYMDIENKWYSSYKQYIEAMKKKAIVNALTDADFEKIINEAPTIKMMIALSELESTIKPIKKIVRKYKDLIGETEYKKIMDKIHQIEKIAKSGDIKEVKRLTKAINEYLLGNVDEYKLHEILRKYIKKHLGKTLDKETLSLLPLLPPATLIKLIEKAGSELSKKLSTKYLELFDDLLDIGNELKHTPLGKIMKYFENRIITELKIKINELPSPELSTMIKNVLDKIDKESLSPELRELIEDLEEKAEKGNVSLEDIEKFTSELSKIDPVKASMIELKSIKAIMDSLATYLNKLKEITPKEIRFVISRDLNKLIESKWYKYIYEKENVLIGKKYKLNPITINFEYALKKLSDYVEELNPEYAKKLKSTIEKLLKEAEEKRVVSESTFLELFEQLRNLKKVKGIKIGLISRLKYAIRDYIDWLNRVNKIEPEAYASLKRMADIIFKDLDALEKELANKYGFIVWKTGKKTLKLPLLSDPKTMRAYIRLIKEKPIIRGEKEIGGMKIVFERKARVLPDGTFVLEYDLTFPENRVFKIMRVTRPIKAKGNIVDIDYYYRVYYDPEALAILQSNPQLFKSLITGELFREIDPKFDVLDNIIIFKKNEPLLSSFIRDIDNILSILLSSYVSSSPLFIIRKYEKEKEKISKIIDKLKPLPNKPSIPGLEIIDVYKTPDNKILIKAIPLSLDKIRDKIGIGKLKIGNLEIELPKLELDEKEYYLYIPIEIELQSEKQKEKQKDKEKQEGEEKQGEGGEKGGEEGEGGTIPAPPIIPPLGFPVIIGGMSSSSERKGKQYEALRI